MVTRRAGVSAPLPVPREQLVAVARGLDAALQARWAQRGIHVGVADGWARFFAEAGGSVQGRLTTTAVENAICEQLLKQQPNEDAANNMVISWITRDDVRALARLVDSGDVGEVSAQQWQLRLFRLELERSSSEGLDDSCVGAAVHGATTAQRSARCTDSGEAASTQEKNDKQRGPPHDSPVTVAAKAAQSSLKGSTAVDGVGQIIRNPKELGQRVAVAGDGWGNGEGGYEAVVTEADDLTFTVISVNTWEETHVLRSCCIPVGSSTTTSIKATTTSPSAPTAAKAAKRRRLKAEASPGQPCSDPAKPTLTPSKGKRATACKQQTTGAGAAAGA